MADPAIRIVSLTVTEGGYFIDPRRAASIPAHPEIVADAASPAGAATAFGAILAGAEGAARGRHRALHRDVLRQPARQRPCHGRTP